jgi:hypothetical protein
MYDPSSALPVEEFLGAERATPEAFRLSLDESTLIDRCLAGDDTAFDQIMLRYQDMVFSLSSRLSEATTRPSIHRRRSSCRSIESLEFRRDACLT